MRKFIDRPHEATALIQRSDQRNTSLAIFIHGFRGSYLGTWGRFPALLRVHADSQLEFQNWDFLFIGYATRNVDTYLDISNRICTEWKKAYHGHLPYPHKYNRLALFGHSLGTLGIRQLLCAWAEQPDGMHSSIHSITLFGTPLNGSPLAKFALRYKIRHALKRNNPQLRMLKSWVAGAHAKQPWPAVKVVLGQDDRVVGSKYAELVQWEGDLKPEQIVLDHSALVKPRSWANSQLVDCVANGLR